MISSSVLASSAFHSSLWRSCSAAESDPKSPAITESVGDVTSSPRFGYDDGTVAAAAEVILDCVWLFLIRWVVPFLSGRRVRFFSLSLKFLFWQGPSTLEMATPIS